VRDKSARALSGELGGLPVFAGLGGGAVDALVDAGRLVHLPSNWALIAENTPADSVYVLLAGTTEAGTARTCWRRSGPVRSWARP